MGDVTSIVCRERCKCSDWPAEAGLDLSFGLVTKSRTFHIYGTDKEELVRWMQAFRKAARMGLAIPLGNPLTEGHDEKQLRSVVEGGNAQRTATLGQVDLLSVRRSKSEAEVTKVPPRPSQIELETAAAAAAIEEGVTAVADKVAEASLETKQEEEEEETKQEGGVKEGKSAGGEENKESADNVPKAAPRPAAPVAPSGASNPFAVDSTPGSTGEGDGESSSGNPFGDAPKIAAARPAPAPPVAAPRSAPADATAQEEDEMYPDTSSSSEEEG